MKYFDEFYGVPSSCKANIFCNLASWILQTNRDYREEFKIQTVVEHMSIAIYDSCM